MESLCAIIITVLPAAIRSIASCIFCSASTSTEAVGSSNKSIGASFKKALAIEILCLCPPERSTPRSPTMVSYPLGSCIIKSWIFAFLHASIISSSVAFSFPQATFCLMAPGNKNTFCETSEKQFLADSKFQSSNECPKSIYSPLFFS